MSSETQYDYDFLVIGAGSGGVRASRMASGLGAKVAVIEDSALGGTCVNVGCVPKKLFVYGSHFSEEFEAAEGFGWKVGESEFHWPTLRDRKTAEIERLNGIYGNILGGANVEIIHGRGVVTGPNTVAVGEQEYTAKNILIAVGGWPYVPEFPGSEHVISSNEVFYLDEFPKRALVVGGGYIAVEFAGIFAGLGAETHQAYRGPMFLRGFDDDLREFVANEMQQKGINLHFNTDVSKIVKNEDGSLKVSFNDGRELEVDTVMYATGRRAKTPGLGLENTKVEMRANGSIVVDENYQTAEPSIYALGDVIGGIELTPVALAEGMALAHNLFGEGGRRVDYDNIATAVFSQPNIATVGLTEAQAKEKYANVDVYKSDFKHMKHTLSGLPERTLMKIIVDRDSDKVLGCHMVGSDAGEIIQGLAVAIRAGATKAIFDTTIGIHPTAAEEFVTMREPVS
ncbi:glutathione-disulfide reductase [Pseudoteredinibacter isoporae]|uniref:Glutathione reductase (NADPH) n=1 Tax=Pseudoteredinibacter isoporae TaxID=570281 RepID=A0A7X0MZF3_9GAMM|nr:glutathione reductase (NADPH) [Pseudoteredinibacter isoporae]NHO88602.1 glutathione-disulfide reductase [Pseudoteredinibacter isoporae]NIB22707.1 glutathione-disulfide reductase [Pseudoteredinibacter isoporae]